MAITSFDPAADKVCRLLGNKPDSAAELAVLPFEEEVQKWEDRFLSNDPTSTSLICDAAKKADNPRNQAIVLLAEAREIKHGSAIPELKLGVSLELVEKAQKIDPANPLSYLQAALIKAEYYKNVPDQKWKDEAQTLIKQSRSSAVDLTRINPVKHLVIEAIVYSYLGEITQTVHTLIAALHKNPSKKDMDEISRMLSQIAKSNPELLGHISRSLYDKQSLQEPALKELLYRLPQSLIEMGKSTLTLEDSANCYRAARALSRMGQLNTQELRFSVLYSVATYELAGMLSGDEDVDEMPEDLFRESFLNLETAIQKVPELQTQLKKGQVDEKYVDTITEMANAKMQWAEHIIDFHNIENEQDAIDQNARVKGEFQQARNLVNIALKSQPNNLKAINSQSWLAYYEAKGEGKYNDNNLEPYQKSLDQSKINLAQFNKLGAEKINHEEYVQAIAVYGWSILEHVYTLTNQGASLLLKAQDATTPAEKNKLIAQSETFYQRAIQIMNDKNTLASIQRADALLISPRSKRDLLYLESRYYYILGRTISRDKTEQAFKLLDPEHLNFKDQQATSTTVANARKLSDSIDKSAHEAFDTSNDYLRKLNTNDGFLENREGFVEYSIGCREFRAGNYIEAIKNLLVAYKAMEVEWGDYREDAYKFLAMSLRNAQFLQPDQLRAFRNQDASINADLEALFKRIDNLKEGFVKSIKAPEKPIFKKPEPPQAHFESPY